jgi:hypothetical protein
MNDNLFFIILYIAPLLCIPCCVCCAIPLGVLLYWISKSDETNESGYRSYETISERKKISPKPPCKEPTSESNTISEKKAKEQILLCFDEQNVQQECFDHNGPNDWNAEVIKFAGQNLQKTQNVPKPNYKLQKTLVHVLVECNEIDNISVHEIMRELTKIMGPTVRLKEYVNNNRVKKIILVDYFPTIRTQGKFKSLESLKQSNGI